MAENPQYPIDCTINNQAQPQVPFPTQPQLNVIDNDVLRECLIQHDLQQARECAVLNGQNPVYYTFLMLPSMNHPMIANQCGIKEDFDKLAMRLTYLCNKLTISQQITFIRNFSIFIRSQNRIYR